MKGTQLGKGSRKPGWPCSGSQQKSVPAPSHLVPRVPRAWLQQLRQASSTPAPPGQPPRAAPASSTTRTRAGLRHARGTLVAQSLQQGDARAKPCCNPATSREPPRKEGGYAGAAAARRRAAPGAGLCPRCSSQPSVRAGEAPAPSPLRAPAAGGSLQEGAGCQAELAPGLCTAITSCTACRARGKR